MYAQSDMSPYAHTLAHMLRECQCCHCSLLQPIKRSLKNHGGLCHASLCGNYGRLLDTQTGTPPLLTAKVNYQLEYFHSSRGALTDAGPNRPIYSGAHTHWLPKAHTQLTACV